MDAPLETWGTAQLSPRPRSGWVRAIREALGMSAAAFARRLGMGHPSAVRALRRSDCHHLPPGKCHRTRMASYLQ